jgi:hypothetical protein
VRIRRCWESILLGCENNGIAGLLHMVGDMAGCSSQADAGISELRSSAPCGPSHMDLRRTTSRTPGKKASRNLLGKSLFEMNADLRISGSIREEAMGRSW